MERFRRRSGFILCTCGRGLTLQRGAIGAYYILAARCSDEVLAWAHSRAAARQASSTKDYLPPRAPANVSHAKLFADDHSRQWQDYVARQIDQREKILMKAVATVMIEEERQREQVASELAGLRDQVKALEAELGELTREMKTRAALAEVTERLDRLEATRPPAPMKVVG